MLVSGGSTPSDKVGGGGVNPDAEIRGEQSPKKNFRPYGPQFDKKIKGGPGPPGPATANDTPCKKA